MNRLKDTVLRSISDQFDQLNAVILRQLSLTAEVLSGTPPSALAEELERNEGRIDAMEVSLRDEVIHVIVLHAPRTANLRMIMACYDTTSNLERVGDLLLNIHEFARTETLSSPRYNAIRPRLLKMFGLAADMVKNAIFAMNCGDERLAKEVIRTDDQVDALWHQILEELQQVENTQTHCLLDIFGMANNIERIGDQATNMAEAVIYVAEGKDIKHTDKTLL